MTSVSMAASSNVPSVPIPSAVTGSSTTGSSSLIDKALSFCGLMRIKKFEVALAQRTTQMQETINQLESTIGRQQIEIDRRKSTDTFVKKMVVGMVGSLAVMKLCDLTANEGVKALGERVGVVGVFGGLAMLALVLGLTRDK